MNLSGTVKLKSSPSHVWQALNDPEVLRRCTPGCKQLTPAADGTYDVLMNVAVGAVRGSYSGKMEISDAIPERQYRLTINGKGNTGFLKAEGLIQLQPSGDETVIEYSGAAQVGGLIAGVGQRIVEGVARNMVKQFFTSFESAVADPGGPQPGN